ncbi:site-2 protease family protein [Cohnella sp. REN36]|uniref:site-2 protease family protein n=1 Tax=Cohnella sp. REN36 TaxID=2887347 RepID=UPI001D15753C|nr:site-2 protease family protein [Cohnella sp. REN36]MCC3377099.1 site-2 protease family protein [Cohnella sp. REN36]
MRGSERERQPDSGKSSENQAFPAPHPTQQHLAPQPPLGPDAQRPQQQLSGAQPPPDDGRPDRKPPGGRKSSWAFGAVLLFLLSKGKVALLALLKFGKPLISMAVTVGAYALIYPWTFALGFVALIFVHELGHILAARRKKLPVSAPYFIPFLGAMIFMKRNPKDAATEADIALGGPLLGSLGALVCYGIGEWTGSRIWHVLAYVGFFLNLLNLLPVHPLDGGRISRALSRWMWVVGAVLGPFAIWYTKSFLFLLIWGWFLVQTYRKFKQKGEGPSHIAEGVYQTTVDPTLPDWYYKGSQHLRDLPYTAYCRMDGQHVVEFQWEAMSFKGELPIDQAIIVKRVYVYQIEGPDANEKLTFKVRAEGVLFEPDNYYEVPKRTKWRIGLLYGGLAVGLLAMMWIIQQAGWTEIPR